MMTFMIAGIGIDIIDTTRFARLTKKKRFMNRVFTKNEQANAKNYLYYPSRFCTKEAFLKALGTGLSKKITWKDIEITQNKNGRPEIKLNGQAKKIARSLRIKKMHLSISHMKNLAISCVVLEK